MHKYKLIILLYKETKKQKPMDVWAKKASNTRNCCSNLSFYSNFMYMYQQQKEIFWMNLLFFLLFCSEIFYFNLLVVWQVKTYPHIKVLLFFLWVVSLTCDMAPTEYMRDHWWCWHGMSFRCSPWPSCTDTDPGRRTRNRQRSGNGPAPKPRT